MLLLLPSSLGALLLGVLLSLGGSGLGIALSEAEDGGSEEGGGTGWGSDEGSAGASSGDRELCQNKHRLRCGRVTALRSGTRLHRRGLVLLLGP